MAESKEVATVEPSESTNLMQQMIAAARDIDVDKLKQLRELQREIVADQRRAEYATDFSRMKPHLPKVIRTKDNQQTKSKYAPLEDINKIVDPILQEYGFATSHKVIAQDEASVTVQSELWHRAGHVESNVIKMPLDKTGIAGTTNKTGPHALSSSITYAKRVGKCALLDISTGDDTDGNTPNDFLTEELVKELEGKLAVFPKEAMDSFLKYMRVDAITDIRATDYGKAVNAIKAKEKGEKKPKAEAK